MPITVRSKEFSAGSPLDFAQLNDMVKDIIQLANSITVVDTGNTNQNATAVIKSTSYVLGGFATLTDVPPLSATAKTGKQYDIKFLDNSNNQITFLEPPRVVCIARTGNAGSGLVVLNQVGDATTVGFTVRAGWVNRTIVGNANVEYIAVGIKKS